MWRAVQCVPFSWAEAMQWSSVKDSLVQFSAVQLTAVEISWVQAVRAVCAIQLPALQRLRQENCKAILNYTVRPWQKQQQLKPTLFCLRCLQLYCQWICSSLPICRSHRLGRQALSGCSHSTLGSLRTCHSWAWTTTNCVSKSLYSNSSAWMCTPWGKRPCPFY